jgi:hypothetical protein
MNVEIIDDTEIYYKEGTKIIHREDGPAIKFINGEFQWWFDGKIHREDGPAVELPDGSKFWLKHGKYHREDGPACELGNGNKEWWKDGELHRENGPALQSGEKDVCAWYKHGELHREDGPAIEWTNGNKYWYFNGERLTEEEWICKKKESENKPKSKKSEYVCFVTDSDGYWYKIPVSEKQNFEDWVELIGMRYVTVEDLKRMDEANGRFDDYRCMHPVNYMFKETFVLKENS